MTYLKLKVDLHIHNSEDLAEKTKKNKRMVSPKRFIDMAVQKGFDAIAFTHHGLLYNDPKVSDYAKKKGIILIPGIEAFINRKHVLLINYIKRKHVLNFDTLRREKNGDMLVIAPHPFYKMPICLEDELEKNLDCFDAIEYCHFYTRLINPNRKAVRLAQKSNLPLVGNSDAHHAHQFGTTYSYVYASDRSIPAIIEAIKQGRVEYVSQPLPYRRLVAVAGSVLSRLPYFSLLIIRKVAYKYNIDLYKFSYRFRLRRLKPLLLFALSRRARYFTNKAIPGKKDMATT